MASLARKTVYYCFAALLVLLVSYFAIFRVYFPSNIPELPKYHYPDQKSSPEKMSGYKNVAYFVNWQALLHEHESYGQTDSTTGLFMAGITTRKTCQPTC